MVVSRKALTIDDGWRFNLGDIAGAENQEFDDSKWRILDLPHDWQIEQTFDPLMQSGSSQGYMPRWQVGLYRLHLNIPQHWDGKIVRICFEGVQRCASCWINGHLLGMRPYGYSSYFYDLTPYLDYGKDNVIAVKVDNTDPVACRWFSGAGIYRHVRLMVTHKLHFSPWGLHVTVPYAEMKRAKVLIEAKIVNSEKQSHKGTAEFTIQDSMGRTVTNIKAEFKAEAAGETVIQAEAFIEGPRLWDVSRPELYIVQARIFSNSEEIDFVEERFGIRSFEFDGETGFKLNGRSLKLKGVNLHIDCGCLGTAAPSAAVWERRLRGLKEIGCNAIRTSHNPPSPEFLDLCDEMGFLVIDEAFDKWHWESGYYYKYFETWWERDLDAMLDRDYNHPSIILWSVGNEVNFMEDPTEQLTLKTLEMLVNHVHIKDATRPVSCALTAYGAPGGLSEFTREQMVDRTMDYLEKVDVAMLNYHEEWYDDYRRRGLKKAVIGSEILTYYRSAGETAEKYIARPAWLDVEEHPWVAGGFIWAGIDYLGEARPYPSKGWASCLMDTCGNLKPRGYHTKALWKSRAEPFIHISVMDETMRQDREPTLWSFPKLSNHWNYAGREGEMMRVAVFSNLEMIRLYLNDKYYGEICPAETADRIAMFFLPYYPGAVRAVGYADGKPVLSGELQTTGVPAGIEVDLDKDELLADGHDVIHAVVTLKDEQGNTVYDAEPVVSFLITGPAFIAGVDNGDLSSDEPYKDCKRKIFRGRCMAVIQSGHTTGTARVIIKAGSLPAVSRSIEIKTGQ